MDDEVGGEGPRCPNTLRMTRPRIQVDLAKFGEKEEKIHRSAIAVSIIKYLLYSFADRQRSSKLSLRGGLLIES